MGTMGKPWELIRPNSCCLWVELTGMQVDKTFVIDVVSSGDFSVIQYKKREYI